jgi:hypothetical protein
LCPLRDDLSLQRRPTTWMLAVDSAGRRNASISVDIVAMGAPERETLALQTAETHVYFEPTQIANASASVTLSTNRTKVTGTIVNKPKLGGLSAGGWRNSAPKTWWPCSRCVSRRHAYCESMDALSRPCI